MERKDLLPINTKQRYEKLIKKVVESPGKLGLPEGPKNFDLTSVEGSEEYIFRLSRIVTQRDKAKVGIPEKTLPILQDRLTQIQQSIESQANSAVLTTIKNSLMQAKSGLEKGYFGEEVFQKAVTAAKTKISELGLPVPGWLEQMSGKTSNGETLATQEDKQTARHKQEEANQKRLPKITIDSQQKRVIINGQVTKFENEQAWNAFCILAARANQDIPVGEYNFLLSQIGNKDKYGDRLGSFFISALRRKIEREPSLPEIILSRRENRTFIYRLEGEIDFLNPFIDPYQKMTDQKKLNHGQPLPEEAAKDLAKKQSLIDQIQSRGVKITKLERKLILALPLDPNQSKSAKELRETLWDKNIPVDKLSLRLGVYLSMVRKALSSINYQVVNKRDEDSFKKGPSAYYLTELDNKEGGTKQTDDESPRVKFIFREKQPIKTQGGFMFPVENEQPQQVQPEQSQFSDQEKSAILATVLLRNLSQLKKSGINIIDEQVLINIIKHWSETGMDQYKVMSEEQVNQNINRIRESALREVKELVLSDKFQEVCQNYEKRFLEEKNEVFEYMYLLLINFNELAHLKVGENQTESLDLIEYLINQPIYFKHKVDSKSGLVVGLEFEQTEELSEALSRLSKKNDQEIVSPQLPEKPKPKVRKIERDRKNIKKELHKIFEEFESRNILEMPASQIGNITREFGMSVSLFDVQYLVDEKKLVQPIRVEDRIPVFDLEGLVALTYWNHGENSKNLRKGMSGELKEIISEINLRRQEAKKIRESNEHQASNLGRDSQ